MKYILLQLVLHILEIKIGPCPLDVFVFHPKNYETK